MKQIELNNISNFLGKIRVNKINDRETKIGLVNIHMELYKKVEVTEYWIADWRSRTIEIYVLAPVETSVDDAEYMLRNKITESGTVRGQPLP